MAGRRPRGEGPDAISEEEAAELARFAERLREAAADAGFTQTGLETEMISRGWVSKGYFSRVFRGHHRVGPERMAQIAMLAHVNFDWLATGRGSKTADTAEPMVSDDDEQYPKRASALRRLRGLLSYQVTEKIREIRLGPSADIAESEWIRWALEEQFKHDRGVVDGPKTPPPRKPKSGKRKV